MEPGKTSRTHTPKGVAYWSMCSARATAVPSRQAHPVLLKTLKAYSSKI